MRRIKNYLSQLLSYRILIYRTKPQTVQKAVKIGFDGRYLFLLDQDERRIPTQLSMKLVDCVNKPTKVVVEMFVNTIDIIDMKYFGKQD